MIFFTEYSTTASRIASRGLVTHLEMIVGEEHSNAVKKIKITELEFCCPSLASICVQKKYWTPAWVFR